jgi:hypothetical protein
VCAGGGERGGGGGVGGRKGGLYADAATRVGEDDEIRDHSGEEEKADAVVIPDVLKRGRERWCT